MQNPLFHAIIIAIAVFSIIGVAVSATTSPWWAAPGLVTIGLISGWDIRGYGERRNK